jgi:hypothetical protein
MRRAGRFLIVLFMLFAIGRGLVELFVIDWGNPASYRADWGGPSLFGVLLVHTGPGVLSAAIFMTIWRRHRNQPTAA